MQLGRLGVWSTGIKRIKSTEVLAAAAEAEKLGYGTLWFPAATGPADFDVARALLQATTSVVVGTAITSIWTTEPADANHAFDKIEILAPGRFLLGIGASHGPVVARTHPGRYARPFTNTANYLRQLTVPRERRILAALGPKMLGLASTQAVGTHPYLVTPSITARTRELLGHGPVVAVELGVVLEENPIRARELAREHLAVYLTLPNYVNNWLRSGYTERDVTKGGSDRLVDDLIAWGSIRAIGDRIRAHYEAGADHVAVQVLVGHDPMPVAIWRAIANEISV
jgi:probable F420-dependent oxidoreductase